MNAIGFFLGRFAWQLGLRRERARWNAVTRETQQLAEAQDLLGKLAWPATESIERLSGDYWQLTDLQTQQQQLRAQSDQLTTENETAQDRLYAIEDQVDHHAQHELNKVLHFPKGESLATHLTPEEYKKERDKMMKEMQENMQGGNRQIRIN